MHNASESPARAEVELEHVGPLEGSSTRSGCRTDVAVGRVRRSTAMPVRAVSSDSAIRAGSMSIIDSE
jgi:hypothetical protein